MLNTQWKEYFLSENRQNVGGFVTWVPGEKVAILVQKHIIL